MEHKIFEDDFLEVYYENYDHSSQIKDGNETLIITFNEMGMSPGQGAWGKTVLNKLNLPYIGFVSKGPNWFPESSFSDAIKHVKGLLQGYDNIVTYGFSQGGYAAIRFASRLEANLVIALSPQYSIIPTDMFGSDKRYSNYFFDANQQPSIKSEDVNKSTFVAIFYDPLDMTDKINMSFISAAITNANFFKIYALGHQTVHLFAGTNSFKLLLESCISKNNQKINSVIRQLKRGWRYRGVFIARNTVASKPTLTKKILEKNWQNLDGESAEIVFKGLIEKDTEFVYRNFGNFFISFPDNLKSFCQENLLNYLIADEKYFESAFYVMIWLYSGLIDLSRVNNFMAQNHLPEVNAWILDNLQKYQNGDSIIFLSGWHKNEDWGRWSKSKNAYVAIKKSFVESNNKKERIKIKPLSEAKQSISAKIYTQGFWEELKRDDDNFLMLPTIGMDYYILKLTVDKLYSLAMLDYNSDGRLIGLGIEINENS